MKPSEPTAPAGAPVSALAVVRGYHQRSKHRFEAYAAGPSTLDWDAQPAPFRHFEGAPVTPLPLVATLREAEAWRGLLQRPFAGLGRAAPAAPAGVEALGAFLNLALGITAWKSLGPDRWAVRANPSSGNLHPIEAYVVAAGIAGLADGVHHYDPRDHVLSQRASFASGALPAGSLLVGLSSVMWREAWKYGERAFRYCQLDCGHALGALRYAAAALGWRLVEQRELDATALARLLGLDRSEDFPGRPATEREEPELLLQLLPAADTRSLAAAVLRDAVEGARWHGLASPIDRHPLFRWPVIDAVAGASRRTAPPREPAAARPAAASDAPPGSPRPLVEVILGRRSAQRFDARHLMPRAFLQELVAALDPAAGLPWDAQPGAPRVALVLLVQRVEGLAPGAYLLPRSPQLAAELRGLLPGRLSMAPLPGLPGLLHLADVDAQPLKRTARSLHCHQDIAASACLSVAMLARFDAELERDPASYRDLLREAGLLGQALYLLAESRGLRGTGIGCYFDDPVHDFIGLAGQAYQSLYHFTLGLPLDDARIETGEPYPQRRPRIPA